MVDEQTIAKYKEIVDSILSQYEPVVKTLESKGPAEIKPYLYLGDFGDAMNLGQLADIGVTHLLNCAGVSNQVMNNIMASFSRPDAQGHKGYKQLEAEDEAGYNMMAHYNEACEYIDGAKNVNGKAMVYCVRGINRSAAICVAYLIVRENMNLSDAVNAVALARGKVLTNPGFKEQLVNFASKHNKLQ